jgi:L-fuconolactonase
MILNKDTKAVYPDETALEPEIAICDPHHHLWEHSGDRYLLRDLMDDLESGHNVVKTVFVECGSGYRKDYPTETRSVGETEFVLENSLKAEEEFGKPGIMAGIVGFADLTLRHGVEKVLEMHVAAGKGRFRGIRQSCAWDENEEVHLNHNTPKGLMTSPKFREGFAYLQKYNLVFDAAIFFHQLPELADLAKAFPDTSIVVNHIGGFVTSGPYNNKREAVFKEWKKNIAALSGYPNVYIKVGGMGMPFCGFDWFKRSLKPDSQEIAKATAPFYLWCIEKLGVNRCMFESNFPVDKMSYSYVAVWNAFKRMTVDYSSSERKALFHDTAVKVYRLS